jgi:phage-related protein
MSRDFKSLNFNGHDLFAECGLIVQEKTDFSAPARDVTSQPVPGRNGNLILDNRRFENRQQKYTCVIAPWFASSPAGLAAAAGKLKSILMRNSGYLPLRDDYTPGAFYRASYHSALDIEEILKQTGRVPLLFDCEPFIFTDVGQQAITITAASAVITNPEEYDARPKITINGSGNVTITINNSAGNNAFNLSGITTGTVIDSELMEVYQGTTSANSKMLTPEFPIFTPGSNTIQRTGSVTSLVIIPRWCKL